MWRGRWHTRAGQSALARATRPRTLHSTAGRGSERRRRRRRWRDDGPRAGERRPGRARRGGAARIGRRPFQVPRTVPPCDGRLGCRPIPSRSP